MATDSNSPVVGRSMMRTARIFQLSTDPAQGLLRQCLDVVSLTFTEQFHQCSAEQFSAPSIPAALQAMPTAIVNAEHGVQIAATGQGLLGPIRLVSVHGTTALSV